MLLLLVLVVLLCCYYYYLTAAAASTTTTTTATTTTTTNNNNNNNNNASRQDVDPGDVVFYEEDGLTRMAIPAEKLRKGWLPVLAYLRELREQVMHWQILLV